MASLVQPAVDLIGFPQIHTPGLLSYLKRTGQEEFYKSVVEARGAGIPDGLILCSFYAKLCYRSLVEGQNANVTRVRGIEDNVKGAFGHGHGSVFEHANVNFVVSNCSRVYTHEQVRHRVSPPRGNENELDSDLSGTGPAYSQTSGRFCRLDHIDLVHDPILDDCKDIILDHLGATEDAVYLMECRKGLRKPNPAAPGADMTDWFRLRDEAHKWVPDNSKDFGYRKKVTSAIRRIAPNGQSNEMGMTLNIRTLRHLVQLRTQGAAEWEIRSIYYQVYCLTKAVFPLMYFDARERVVDDLPEVYGMRVQPYEHVPAA
jgi:thymidylate synthase (FAD)